MSFSPEEAPRRIGVYSGGEIIGDAMAKLPFLRALRGLYPSARIVWITSGDTVYETLLRPLTLPVIDSFARLPDRPRGLGWLKPPLPVFDQPFDIVIDTQMKGLQTFWLRRALPTAVFVSTALRGWLSSGAPGGRPARRDGDLINRLLSMLDILASGLTSGPVSVPPFHFSDRTWIEAAHSLLPEGRNYIGLVVGAGQAKKCWPLDHFISLARSMRAKGYTPVLVLGPQEQALEAALRDALPEAVFPLAGQPPDPRLTIALAQRLRAAVANDSGGAHLVAAGGPPMVWIFRKDTVRDKFAPPLAALTAIAPQDIGKTSLTDIPVSHVESALYGLLRDGQKRL